MPRLLPLLLLLLHLLLLLLAGEARPRHAGAGNATAVTTLAVDGARVRLVSNVVRGAARTVLETLNVPFAAPPLGALRFRPPQPVSVADFGRQPRDATVLGPGCVQVNATYPISEDCLQLNVWHPAAAAAAAAHPAARLPIFFWVFGGGLTGGSGRTFNGTRLARLGAGAVVVSFNYRLAALGFYADTAIAAEDPRQPATGSLNGVLDVLAALKFVRQHAAAFGGDPARITIGGESSGSMNACILAFSPLAKGLFQNLVMESGACTGPWFGPNTWDRATSLRLSAQYATAALAGASPNGTRTPGVPSSPTTTNAAAVGTALSQLRGLSVSDLTRNATAFDSLNFGLDGYLLSEHRPRDRTILHSGAVLLGGNTLDTTCASPGAVPAIPTNMSGLHATLKTYFIHDADVRALIQPYLRPDPDLQALRNDPATIWLRMSRDAGVTCPTLWLAERLAQRPGATGRPYLYSFGYNATHPSGGVWHGGEVPLVWQRDQPNSKATAVAARVGKLWMEFVQSGSPGKAHVWPAFTEDAGQFLKVDDRGRFGPQERFGKRMCAHWQQYMQRGRRFENRFDNFGYLC